MQIVARSRNIRISPRKMRLVVDSIRHLGLAEIRLVLSNINKRAAKPILLTFKQAMANATNNFKLNEEDLRLKEIQVGKGPTYKRWRAVSRGRGRSILKRTSHIRIVLEGEKSKPIEKLVKKKRKEKLKNRI